MSQPELINEGLSLMLFGMGFVFVFLTILVIATRLMSVVILRFTSDKPEPAHPPSKAHVTKDDLMVDPIVLAAINEAVRQHRAHRP